MRAVDIPVAIVIIVGAAVLAVLVMALVRRIFPGPLLIEPTRGTPMTTVVGTAFAVLLAFITFAAFQTYNGAKSGAQQEAVATLELARSAQFFPVTQGDELRGDFVCYGRAVVYQEWPAMRRGTRAPVVDAWIATYRGVWNGLDLAKPREQVGFSEMLAEARDRTEGRQNRLSEVTPSVPTPLWLALILGGVMAIGIQLAMADRRERLVVHGAMLAGLAAIVTAGLLLVNFLDHPYQQHTGSIEPTGMRTSLVLMGELRPAVQPPCTAAGLPLTS
jgi:hypothetical protein